MQARCLKIEKCYAIKNGREKKIVNTWEECKALIDGYPEALFKSFSSLEDAKRYLEGEEKEDDFDMPTAYIDGSFDEVTKRYSFGCIFFFEGKIYKFYKAFLEDELSSMRNVAGEIKGAGFIIQYCLNRGIKNLVIYYDYIGIEKWYNLEWKAKMYGTKKYQEFAEEAKKNIDVKFVKVMAHTNDKYNDTADYLAKKALDLV